MRALILRKQPYGESDLIIQFFLESGRIGSGFAPGARKSRKRFPHQFHPAGIYNIQTAREFETGTLLRIQGCDLEAFHSKLTDDLELWTRWSMVLEWILADEGQGFEFEEVLTLMKEMAEGQNTWAFYKFFILQMQVHGLLPRLDRCIICSEALNDRVVFSVSEGGVGHSRCIQGVSISSETLQSLFRILDPSKSLSQVVQNKGSAQLHHELDQIMVPFLSFHLGRSLRAHRLFNEINVK
jgi:DNA repair protein RecO